MNVLLQCWDRNERLYCGVLSSTALQLPQSQIVVTRSNPKNQLVVQPHLSTPTSNLHSRRELYLTNTVTMVYTLVVHLYAKDDQESISKLIAKLQEASQVYSNDKECLGWCVSLTYNVTIRSC